MSTPINDGGPAFPVTNPAIHDVHGMSLRDWFAGQALAAMPDIKDSGDYSAHDRRSGLPECHAEFVASGCYRYADAMLKARGATQ